MKNKTLIPVILLIGWLGGPHLLDALPLPRLSLPSPGLPPERLVIYRSEPVVRVAVPSHAISLATATIAVTGESQRKRGPCKDTRKVIGNVTLHVTLPPEAVTDGDTIQVDASRLTTVLEQDLRMRADDGTCSRTAHLFGRPTSSPELNHEAEQVAVDSARGCMARALAMVGGLQKSVQRSLAAWKITRPVQVTGEVPKGLCLSETLAVSDV
jgi:hypothetical protein